MSVSTLLDNIARYAKMSHKAFVWRSSDKSVAKGYPQLIICMPNGRTVWIYGLQKRKFITRHQLIVAQQLINLHHEVYVTKDWFVANDNLKKGRSTCNILRQSGAVYPDNFMEG